MCLPLLINLSRSQSLLIYFPNSKVPTKMIVHPFESDPRLIRFKRVLRIIRMSPGELTNLVADITWVDKCNQSSLQNITDGNRVIRLSKNKVLLRWEFIAKMSGYISCLTVRQVGQVGGEEVSSRKFLSTDHPYTVGDNGSIQYTVAIDTNVQ